MKLYNRQKELMDIIKKTGEDVPVSFLTKQEYTKVAIVYLISEFNFRVYRDIDKILKTKNTSLSFKRQATKNNNKNILMERELAEKIVKENGFENVNKEFLNHIIDIATNVIKNLINVSKTKRSKILADIETKDGQIKLLYLCIIALGEVLIEEYSEIFASRTLELMIKSRADKSKKNKRYICK
ncbi:MAG: hypothetical protein ACRC6U_09150 [Fusobacteriaceae bacterium]